MPSALRFRPLQHRNSITSIPRTPKSPWGAYTGEVVPYGPHRPGRFQRTKATLLVAVLLATLLGGASWFYPQLLILPGATVNHTRPSLSRLWRPSPSSSSTPSSNAERFVPSFPLYEMTFQDNYIFQRKGKAADRAWETMFPHGGGSVAIKNPREYGLPPSFAAPDDSGKASGTEVYEVSVIRQLGCLTLLRRILIDYEDNVPSQVQTQAHAFHCLDHVRQAILCASDTSLEAISERESGLQYPDVMSNSEGSTPGFKSARHTCKNWSEVRAWIELNRPDDR
ncbi:uncharacterized protein A1O9_11935 [Exophiala aquamarina CBS 119918]|uniref:Uncharacterized protein n=1 Tax=Exophiala aquamarina CBS 119918 TaxID=1182545 RepID=A0A072P8P5_9EURO|nr:uncharacterized protein A1O9_11935 [Exophiala aquamarina CBS 119918]KEF51945.1 hypothetical protein A1O9_11935 [Exophiala aquamarina CBS 119918]